MFDFVRVTAQVRISLSYYLILRRKISFAPLVDTGLRHIGFRAAKDFPTDQHGAGTVFFIHARLQGSYEGVFEKSTSPL